jgi:hypothetical protein
MLTRHHSPQHSPKAAAEVYQTSTMAALPYGIYDGDVTIADVAQRIQQTEGA